MTVEGLSFYECFRPPGQRARSQRDAAGQEIFGRARPFPGHVEHLQYHGRRTSDIHAGAIVSQGEIEKRQDPRKWHEEYQRSGIGEPAMHGRRTNGEIGAYFDGTVINMSKNMGDMQQRAHGELAGLGGISAQVVSQGQRDPRAGYSPPRRANPKDWSIFPQAAVASHPVSNSNVYFGRPSTDISVGTSGPGWSRNMAHCTTGDQSQQEARAGFGRTNAVAPHLSYTDRQDPSYQPPRQPNTDWRHGTATPLFDYGKSGCPGLFPRRETDITGFYSAHPPRNWQEQPVQRPRPVTDVTDVGGARLTASFQALERQLVSASSL